MKYPKSKQLRHRVFEDIGSYEVIKKPKKVKKSTLRNKADKLFSLYIRSRGYCQLKGLDKISCGGVLQTMHIVTRGIIAFRYDPNNALCGCAGHHVYYTHHPYEWAALIEKYFEDKWIYVHNIGTPARKTEDLYREVIERYS